MASPALEAAAARNVSEADLRALALAKVKAQKVYNEVWLRDTRGYSDEQLIDHEIEVSAAMRALMSASRAFSEAV